jgi:hypothetical protein
LEVGKVHNWGSSDSRMRAPLPADRARRRSTGASSLSRIFPEDGNREEAPIFRRNAKRLIHLRTRALQPDEPEIRTEGNRSEICLEGKGSTTPWSHPFRVPNDLAIQPKVALR